MNEPSSVGLAAEHATVSFRLYISGNTALSNRAIVNIRSFCERHLKGRYELEVKDVVKDPQSAADDQILALPTLLMIRPISGKRFVGDLSNTERILALLG